MSDDPRRHLRRDPQSATGLSFVQGEPVPGVDALPAHHVEIHAFRDADRAQAFVDGLGFAKANGIAWTWEPESPIGMRLVLTARLWEDRAAGRKVRDVVPVVEHGSNDFEHRARVAADARRTAEDAARREGDRVRMQPLRKAFAAAGIAVDEACSDWVRAFSGRVTVQFRRSGRYEVECGVDLHRREGDGDLIGLYASHAAACGFSLDPAAPMELGTVTVDDPADAVETARRMVGTVDGFGDIAKRFWHARFMETMRVTPTIRRFIAGAAENGVSISFLRRNLQARAGGVLLKRGDVSRLVYAGWLSSDHEHFPKRIEVTEAGLAAVGLERRSAAGATAA
jgi:hypothetical protein